MHLMNCGLNPDGLTNSAPPQQEPLPEPLPAPPQAQDAGDFAAVELPEDLLTSRAFTPVPQNRPAWRLTARIRQHTTPLGPAVKCSRAQEGVSTAAPMHLAAATHHNCLRAAAGRCRLNFRPSSCSCGAVHQGQPSPDARRWRFCGSRAS